ncbi:uncharacterized protein LOC100370515 [Saccoglossus kowalevskii]|uniref:Uncharacterized protein LOC100370515 n=1 Tax=Saccoglossus kowalevskii TaxID=10224 RepID=A0ABM0GSB8_SACKO|nr:PREDICTED: uncharacterized protein LOC100370515 [Saccoglossus kowalevskii]
MSTAIKLFTISVSINFSVLTFHFLPGVVVLILKRFRERWVATDQLLNLCDEKPWFAGKFLVDQLSSIILTITAIVVFAVSGVVQDPFGMPLAVQIAVAMDVGHYSYKLAQDFLLRKHITSFRFDALHHLVAIMTLSVFLAFEENGLNCLVGLLFEGNLPFFGISQLLKTLEIESCSRVHGVNKHCGFISTIIFRGIVPVVFIIVSMQFGSPFSMNYAVISFYFLSCVFFLILNIWVIKISFTGVVKYNKERRKHLMERALIGPRGANDDESAVGVDGTSAVEKFRIQTTHNNLRYMRPCANTNLNTPFTDSGRVSNRTIGAVANIQEKLFPAVLNNVNVSGSMADRTSSLSTESDRSRISFSFLPENVVDSRDSTPVSLVPRTELQHQLDAIRAPPDGEDCNDRQLLPRHGTMASKVSVGLPWIKRSLSESSISEKSSLKSEEHFFLGATSATMPVTLSPALPLAVLLPPPHVRIDMHQKQPADSQTSVTASSSSESISQSKS